MVLFRATFKVVAALLSLIAQIFAAYKQTSDTIRARFEALLEVEALLVGREVVVEHGEVLAQRVRLAVSLAAEVVQCVVVRDLRRRPKRQFSGN